MTPETTAFAFTVLLGFVHVLVQSVLQTRLHGTDVLVGPRDDFRPADDAYLGRARRANDNFRESAPWALGLMIMVQVAGVTSGATAAGAWLYVVARVAYLPLYLFGVPWLRTLAWSVSLVGLAMLLVALFG